MPRFDVTDAEWTSIAPLLPGAEGKKIGRPRPDDREVRNGISFILRSGAPWRGLPARIVLSQGQASDEAAVPVLPEGRTVTDAVADRGHDAMAVLDPIARHGGRGHIPTCRDRRVQRTVDKNLRGMRNRVEPFFDEPKHFRRIATRCDELAGNFLAAVLIAATRPWTRLESTT